MTEYRITYAIERRQEGGEYEEIGFGSSGTSATVASAAYDVESQIANEGWETSDGMPDPKEIA